MRFALTRVTPTMAFPSAQLTDLASLAHRLPATCWLASRMAQAPAHWGTLPVWWVQADLDMAALDLAATRGADGPWRPPVPAAALAVGLAHPEGALLWVDGNLRLQGALTGGWASPACAPDSSLALHALVMGDAQMHCALVRGAHVHVQGNLSVQTLLWGDGPQGAVAVQGHCAAQVGLFTRGFTPRCHKPPSLEFTLLDAGLDDASPVSLQPGRHRLPCHETLGLVMQPYCLCPDNAGTGSLAEMLDAPAVLDAARAQRPLTHSTADVHALWPPPPAVFADESISVANIEAAVRCPLIAPKEFTAQGWFDQTDFVLCRQHVDADGDARQDSVFITLWKQWDFYLGIDRPSPPKGWLLDGWAQLRARILRAARRYPALAAASGAVARPELVALCRPYTQGVPGAWRPLRLDEQDGADAAARSACRQAWQGVLDYVRKGTAQARARYPLWAQLMAEVTPQRLEQTTSLPLFTELYNDWWDSEKNGFWAGQIWIGARQPCLHQGQPWGRAFKLSWKNGDDAPGDAPDNAHSAYQFDVDEAREGPPVLHVHYAQRQADGRLPLPWAAADHIARLLRLFRQAQTHLHRMTADMQEKARTTPPVLQLLATPPLPPDRPDAAVFGAEWMERSDRWQNSGRAHVDQARRQLAAAYDAPTPRRDSNLLEGSGALFGDALGALPTPYDPRAAQAEAVLQLAREVHRHADPQLSARFRQRFAFAPDAFAAHAYRAATPTGPALLLDDGRMVVRNTSGGAGTSAWWLLAGVHATGLAGLQCVGRSPNRQCFAKYDGTQLTTHVGWEGPTIARFALPQGTHGTASARESGERPAAPACDELVPFSDGLKVLWRNATGVYLLSPDAVQRLHPQEGDREDGPLDLDMLHMALSPDERHIAVGDRGSQHNLLNAEGELLAQRAPLSGNACHAAFTHEGSKLLTSACHLYTGITEMISLADDAWPVPAAEVGTGDDAPTPHLPHGAAHLLPAPVVVGAPWRVEATATLPGMLVVGDAAGWLHALDESGHLLWHHHIGGAVSAVDLAPDGSTLIASSHSGYVVRLKRLDTGADPFSIGTSAYAELDRWIFWRGEPAPLHW